MINICLARRPERPRYPHPPFSARELLAVENAIRLAWQRCIKDNKAALQREDEPRITAHLQRALDKLRRSQNAPAYFNVKNFESPSRDAAAEDYKGDSIDQQPDLVFRLCGLTERPVFDPLHDGIFVECKLIEEKSSSRTVGAYARDGMMRFVDGRYGWAMPHGMMVAYNRSSKVFPDVLRRYLQRRQSAERLNTVSGPIKCGQSRGKPAVFYTVHRRKFKHRRMQPGHIELRHLWLEAG